MKASFFKPLHNVSWMSEAHRFQLGMAFAEWLSQLDGGAFRSGMKQWVHHERRNGKPKPLVCPAERMAEFHQMAVDAMTERSEMKDKLAAVTKELEAMKRKGRSNVDSLR